MTGRHMGSSPPLEFTRRDWKPQLAAVVVPSLLYVCLTIFLLTAAVQAPGGGWTIRLLQLATALGRGVIDQLGWVFGILITIQLGCLIALLGGQIIARNRRDEADLRTALSLFSVFPVVALSPALTVAAIAAFRVGELRGALFVIVPALVLTITLAVFIGTFDVADELTKLDFAKGDEARALSQIKALEGLPAAPFRRMVAWRSVHLILLGSVVSLILSFLFKAPTSPSWVYTTSIVLVLVSIPVTVYAVGAISASLKPTLAAVGLVAAGLLVPAILAMQIVVVATLFALQWHLGTGALIAALCLLVDTTRVLFEAREVRAGRAPAGFWRRGGGLAHAGTSSARKAAEKERDNAHARIDELEQKISRLVDEAPVAAGHRRNDDGVPGDS